MKRFPSQPDHAAWRSVLKGEVGAEELRWLTRYVGGWPVLRDEPPRGSLWNELFERDPWWDEEHLTLLLRTGDGPPSAGAALRVLRHPLSGLETRRALGQAATCEHSSHTAKGKVAAQALREDEDRRSAVAAYLAQHHQVDPNSLLSESVRLYDERFDQVLLPAAGGGAARTETFLRLAGDGWFQGVDGLLQTVVALTAPSSPQ